MFADSTRFSRLRLDLLTGIILRFLTMGEYYFDFMKKRQGKKVF